MAEQRKRAMAIDPQDVCGLFVVPANGLGRWDTSRRNELT